jgi:hypothetical protein
MTKDNYDPPQNRLMLPQEAVEEFKGLYKKRYGIDLTDQEASFRANNLVDLHTAVYDDSSPKL